MIDERAKFIRDLQRTIKKSVSATERSDARKMLMKILNIETGGESEIVIDGDKARDLRSSESSEPRQPTQFDDAVPPTTTHSELSCLLMLVQPDAWMRGSWGETAGGWSGRDGKVLTFDEARALVADRIAELGLDAQKVYAYPKSRGGTIQEAMAFYRASFEVQMAQFRN